MILKPVSMSYHVLMDQKIITPGPVRLYLTDIPIIAGLYARAARVRAADGEA